MLSALFIAGWLFAQTQSIDIGTDEGADEDALEQIDEAVVEPAATAATAPGSAPESAPDSAPESAPASEPATATASAPASQLAEQEEEEESEADSALCATAERARYVRYAGLGAGGIGLLGAIGFFTVGLVERLAAQSLLDTSPAFGKLGDQYVVHDPHHADVAAYDSHRATASVMTQLVWISLGVSAVGGAVAIVSWWLGDELDQTVQRDDAGNCQLAGD